MTASPDLVGHEYVADLCAKTRRTVQGWMRPINGHAPILTAEVTVSGRPLWRREAIQAWCDAGRPAGEYPSYTRGLDPIPALMGVDDVADRCGVTRKAVEAWRDRGAPKGNPLPDPEIKVAGVLIWLESTIDAWACAGICDD